MIGFIPVYPAIGGKMQLAHYFLKEKDDKTSISFIPE